MASSIPALKILFGYEFIKAVKSSNKIKGAVFYDKLAKSTITVYAEQVIDATELGDVMADAGIPFDVGMEANSITGENVNIPASNRILQDITYSAILQDYGPSADCTLVKPAFYNPMEFDCCCNEFCSDPGKLTSNVTAKKMLDYGKLPNGKYMVNWPAKGNDIYLDLIDMNTMQREEAMQKAKDKTLRFIYFLQTQFRFKNLGLAKNEFPTTDRLPLIPYYREGRRVKGLVRFNLLNIANPFNEQSPLYRTGISVGDYPVDHHHKENPYSPQHLSFYPVPSFNIPLGALIPEKFTGIIIAEKGISVTNVVNGTTRLQPCVMLTGQAAGALAALCVFQKKNAKQISIRDVQKELLKSGAYIMPYYDLKPGHPFFMATQKIGATGILKGIGQPNAWANRTWFYPDSLVDATRFIEDFKSCIPLFFNPAGKFLTVKDLFIILQNTYPALHKNKIITLETFHQTWLDSGLKDYDENRNVKRVEAAVIVDKWLKPFETILIGFDGKFLQSKIK